MHDHGDHKFIKVIFLSVVFQQFTCLVFHAAVFIHLKSLFAACFKLCKLSLYSHAHVCFCVCVHVCVCT